MNTIRTIRSPVTLSQWEMHKMDVKSSFLNGDLNEYIHMQQPHNCIIVETSSLV